MEEVFSGGQDPSAYMAQGFNIRVFRSDDYLKIMNVGVILALVFVYGFVILLTLVGLTNVISTTSANVLLRGREFAVLQSVGMTGKQLKTMLFGEGAAYALITVLASATVGIPVSRLIVQALAGDLWFFRWNLNLTPTLAALPVLLTICAAIPLICYRFIQKTSVVERLRVE